jgi:hypothetical protein
VTKSERVDAARALERVQVELGQVRTILLLHIISARPSKQSLMVRTFLKVYISSAPILFLQEQIKDIIITLCVCVCVRACAGGARAGTF